jgi:hypothetical protein
MGGFWILKKMRQKMAAVLTPRQDDENVDDNDDDGLAALSEEGVCSRLALSRLIDTLDGGSLI